MKHIKVLLENYLIRLNRLFYLILLHLIYTIKFIKKYFMANKIKNNKNSMENFEISTAKNTIVYVSSKIIGAFSSFLLIIFLAYFLGVKNFGIYSIIFSFYLILGIGGSFGIGTAFRKKLIEKNRIIQIINNGYFIALIIGIIIFVFGFLSSNYFAGLYHQNISIDLKIVSFTFFLFILFNLTGSALVGINKIKQASIVNISYYVSLLISTVILVLNGYQIFGAIIGLLIGVTTGLIIGIIYLIKNIELRLILPSRKIISEIFGFSFPVMITNVSVLGITNFAIMFLALYVNPFKIGNYTAAFRLARIIEVLLISSTFILLPTFSEIFNSKKLRSKINVIYNNSLYYILIVLIPLILFLISSSLPLSNILFSKQYSLTSFYFQIMVIGFGILIVTNFSTTILISYGNTKKLMKYQLLVISIELVMLLISIPLFKIIGALAVLFIITPILSDIIFLKVLSNEFSIKLYHKILKLIIPTLILFVILYFSSFLLHYSKITIITNLILIIILYPLSLIFFDLINQKNIDFIRKIVNNLSFIKYFTEPLLRYTEISLKKIHNK